MAPTISLCMIVRNEAANLPRCLASVTDDVDELVIVDTGSTDATPAVAASLGAKVWHQGWQEDFAQARNAALEHATGEWVLHLDADEEIAPASQSLVRKTAGATNAAGLLVNVRSRNGQGELTEFYDSWQVRLFRNRPEFRYELAVHEQIIYAIARAGGKVLPSSLQIIHHGYLQDTVQGDCPRVARNVRLLEQALARQPANTYLCAHLGLDYFKAGRPDDALASLRRCLEDLDGRSLPPELLHKVFITLAQIGLARRDFRLAVACSQASLDLGGDDFVTLMALKVAAYAHMGAGWSQIGPARGDLIAVASGGGLAGVRLEPRLLAIRRELDLARGCFARMLGNDALTVNARSLVQSGLRRLDGMLDGMVDARLNSRTEMPAAWVDPGAATWPDLARTKDASTL